MMKIISKIYDCSPPRLTAAFQRRANRDVCSLSLALVAICSLTPALAGEVKKNQGASQAALQHCAETSSDKDRLACFDDYLRVAHADVGKTAGPVASDLVQCAKLVQDSVRVACFDAAAFVAGSLPVEMPALAEDSASQVRPNAVESYADLGYEQMETVAQKKNTQKASQISATVTDLRRNAFGQYSFHLDNGQVWQQTENERFIPPDGDFRVEIKRGAISGYRLHLDDRNKVLRVKRVQ